MIVDTICSENLKISYFCQCSVNSKGASPCKLVVVCRNTEQGGYIHDIYYYYGDHYGCGNGRNGLVLQNYGQRSTLECIEKKSEMTSL